MPMLEQPLVVVGDVHFSHGGRPDTGKALARLIARSEGAEVVLNGDVWNLSLDLPSRDPHESVLPMLAPETELPGAVRRPLPGGGPLPILPGKPRRQRRGGRSARTAARVARASAARATCVLS